MSKNFSRTTVLVVIGIIVLTGVTLHMMGRTPWYKYGSPGLWSGDVLSDTNSQHLSDAYTFTHVIHGIGFYALLKLVARRLPMGARLIVAVILEAAWEIFENTDFVIGRYREATISLDYYGDSILNVVGDILAAIFGFMLAARLKARTTILLVVFIEVALIFWIRDSLFLNILMLIYPPDAIKMWQMGK